MSKRILVQNTLKVLSSYLIQTLDTTDERFKAVEHLQQYLDEESKRILKGDASYDRCSYCGEPESLRHCEYCSAIYCTKQCAGRHDDKGCIKVALDNILQI